MSTLATPKLDKAIPFNWDLSVGSTASSSPDNESKYYSQKNITFISETSLDIENEVLFPIDPEIKEDTKTALEEGFRYSIYNFKDKKNDSSITNQIEQNIYGLQNIYGFINKPSLVNYLKNNANIISKLQTIPQAIVEYFSKYETLTLELLDEFEEQEPEKLRITIFTDMTMEDANKFLREFRIDWLYKNIDPLAIRLMTTLGFK